MIPVRGVGRPVRIGIMRSRDLDATAGFGNAKEFCDKGHHVWHVFSDVTTNDLIEFVVRKWIRRGAEIVNYIRVGFRIGVDANCARRLVPTATGIENFFRRSELAGGYLGHGFLKPGDRLSAFADFALCFGDGSVR